VIFPSMQLYGDVIFVTVWDHHKRPSHLV